MRDATKEERESIDNYIKSISHKIDDEVDLPIKHESKPYLMLPLPDGATNGDMIKAMFPNGAVAVMSYPSNKVGFITRDGNPDDNYVWYPTSWWNAPYKKRR